MQTIDLQHAPLFIQNSLLYQQIKESSVKNDSFTIDLHSQYYKPNYHVNSTEDLDWLLETLRYWMIDDIPYTPIFHYVFSTKINNHLQMKHFQQNMMNIIEKYFDMDIINDIKIIMNQQYHLYLQTACVQGRFHFIQFLIHKKISVWDFEKKWVYLIDTVSNMNDMYSDQYICNSKKDIDPVYILCRYNHLKCLQFIFSIYKNKIIQYDWISYYINTAIYYGHLTCVQYMHQLKHHSFTRQSSFYATLNGHVDCLQYVHENIASNKRNPHLCRIASENGHLKCLQYAHENNYHWNSMTTAMAANNGYLDCLQYAHENGCSWNELTTQYAVDNNHLNCLQYAYENQCPSFSDIYFRAASKGSLECFQYLDKVLNQSTISKRIARSMAKKNNHDFIVHYIDEQQLLITT